MKNPLIKPDTKKNQSTVSTNDRFVEIKLNIDTIKSTMNDNLDKIIERKENIDQLEKKTELLSHNATIFEKSAKRMKQKICLQNIKTNIIIFFFILGILAIITCTIYFATKN
jgi:hypothetical protein